MAKKKWKDLSQAQKSTMGILTVVQLSLMVAALNDLRQRPSDEIRGNRWLWVAASFVNYIGPILYFTIGRKPKSASATL